MMSRNEPDDVRIAAESIYGNIRPMNQRAAYQSQSQFDINRGHPINLISEDLLGGYMHDGRMSVVRRFFCLFITFDLVFISLLWLICIMINGDSIFNALQKHVMHYTIYTSFFDVVGTAICRFVILLLFYGVCYINHWLIIALSTSCSCLFLISKVFYFNWVDSPQPIFGVVLILTSFVLSWGEAWFFDCRVIPQERHARHYFSAFASNERSPLLAPLLASQRAPPPESASNFYSPYDSAHNSDNEEEQDEEYRQMGLDCVRKAYELLESSDWKVEKVTQKGDTIQSTQREKLGKIYRLTARIRYPAKPLLDELFHKIEHIPKWNPTLLESKVLRKINTYTDVTYQATVGGGGGLVKARDFVNLRCWRLCRDGKVIEDSDDENGCKSDDEDDEDILNRSCEGSVSTTDNENDFMPSSVGNSSVKLSKSSVKLSENRSSPSSSGGIFRTLSKSLGAKDFQGQFDFADPPPLDDDFHDAKEYPSTSETPVKKSEQPKTKDKIYVSAAISIEYPSMPPVAKYTRGENLVSCWAMREVQGKSDVCIFEWLLCLDLKGYMPRYVLDNAYTTFMTDYMTHLRKYVCELRQKRKRSASHRYPVLDDE